MSTTEQSAIAGGLARSAPLMGGDGEPTLFELSVEGRRAASFRRSDVPEWSVEDLVPAQHLRSEPLELAAVSERDLVGHFTRLTHRQYSVDLGAYPLGSCTMKYNPKLCDEAAALTGLTSVHPSAPAWATQGWIELLADLTDALCVVTGMDAVTLQPPAGAAGELTRLVADARLARGAGASATHHRHSGFGPWYEPGLGHACRLRDGHRCLG